MRLTALILILTSALLPAGDSSERAIREMVTDSPWAREASVTIKGDGGALGTALTGSAGSIGGDAIAATAAVPTIIVRWESAAPVCEACAKGGLEKYFFSCYSKIMYLSGLSAKFVELSRAFYILTMSNYPKQPSAGDGDAPQHSAAANAQHWSGWRRGCNTWTLLRRKGKAPLLPAKVLILPAAGPALLPVILFSRRRASPLMTRKSLSNRTGSWCNRQVEIQPACEEDVQRQTGTVILRGGPPSHAACPRK